MPEFSGITRGTPKGPSLASVIAIYRGELRKWLDTKRSLNDAIRWALLQGGDFWIRVFLPRRFEAGYARTALGYRASRSYEDWKVQSVGKSVSFTEDYAAFRPKGGASPAVRVEGPQPSPFVFGGSSRRAVLGGARSEAAVTAGKAILRVRFPLGNIAFRNADTFTRLPSWEYDRVVREVTKALATVVTPVARQASSAREWLQTPKWGRWAYAGGWSEQTAKALADVPTPERYSATVAVQRTMIAARPREVAVG